jgi:MarR family transcriptional regulator, organic hydroperoxide resistance regulator
MSQNLRSALKQGKPFACPEEEIFLSIIRTADQLQRVIGSLLKEHDLSITQYNVLRILRGTEKAGLTCGEISERMVTRDPDITRLLDRLEKRALVTRIREEMDRRIIRTCITSMGRDLINTLDAPVTAMHRKQLGHINSKQQIDLINTLEIIREINPEKIQ